MSGMIARVIENWLTRVDERGFQLPFCQLLASKGYRIVHNSIHGPFEQGKDIIAFDQDGQPCGLQLKVGDIDQNRWRHEVRPEIEELLDIPIHHPSIPKDRPHRSVLVLTGTMSDPVRREIDDRNVDRTKKGLKPLETIVGGEILAGFASASESILPKEVEDLHRLLELYIRAGTSPFPKADFASMLASLGPVEQASPKKAARFAASVALVASYVIAPFERASNWWAAADGWIGTTSYLMAIAEASHATKEVAGSIELGMQAAYRALEELAKEALASNDLLQDEDRSLFDGWLVPYRATILCGYLSAWRLSLGLGGQEDWRLPELGQFLDKFRGELRLYSEGATPLLIITALYRSAIGNGDEADAMLQGMTSAIIAANSREAQGLMKPYYEVEDVARYQLHVGNRAKITDETFHGSSFSLPSLIGLLVGLNRRTYLQDNWRALTHISVTEFRPTQTWETLLYRSEHGNEDSRFLNQTQSWTDLAKSGVFGDGQIPEVLKRYHAFIPLLLVSYPHRLTEQLVTVLAGHISSLKDVEPLQ